MKLFSLTSFISNAFVLDLRLLILTIFLITTGSISAQTYSDNASSYGGVWGPTNSNNSNSCSNVGFGDWTFTYGANTGSFIGNPSNNGMGTTGIGTTAFGLFATGSQYCNAYRSIRGGMQVGDALSFYWAINFDAGGVGSKGFDLRNGGTTVFNVNNAGSATITTSNGTAFTAYGTAPMLVTLTRTSSSAYSFTMTARNGGATYSTTINSASSIDGINFYIGNQNDAAGEKNIYINAFQLLKPRYRSAASGNWSEVAAWEISTNGGASWSAATSVPSGTFDAITIRNGHSITLNTSASVSNLVIDPGGTFNNGTSQTLTMAACNSTITNNGTFNRNTGTVTFSSTGTVTGAVEFHNLNISGGLTLGAVNKSTIHNNLTINANGAIVASAPLYAVGSTLIYNSGGDYKRGNEWTSSLVAAEQPFHVRVNSGTILDMDVKKTFETDNAHYDGEGRQMRGDLDLYGTLTMGGNGGTMAEDLIVGGNVTIRGTASGVVGGLILGSQKPSDSKIADIQLGGNWLHETGGTFDASRRAVIFNGSTTAEQSVTFSGTENFGYFIINKSNNGTVKMFCNARVIGTNQGNLFQILNGNLDLNGTTMTLETFDVINNVEQNILIGDLNASILTRNINNTSATPATFRITHTDGTQRVTRVLQNVAGSLLSFGTNVVVVIEGSSTANMGINFGSAVTTINGTLQINDRGYVDVNPPTYTNNSLLRYNIAGNYRRSVEWSTATDPSPGFPFNVQTSASTNFIAGGNSNTATVLNLRGSLTIDAGTTFDMTNSNANNMTVPLTVGLDINIAGTLLASQLPGGTIILGRSWNRTGAGIFTHYTRSVTFNTSRDATLSAPGAGESFHTLIINKPSAGTIGTNFIGYRVTLNSPALVSNILNLTSGYFITTPTNLMTIGAAGSVTGTGTDGTGGAIESFVDGPLRKTGTSNFVFPSGEIVVGSPYSAYHYRPIGISILGSTSFDYTAEFIRGNPYTQGLISPAATAAGLQAISYCEYWNLTRTGGPTSITVTPSWSTHNVWSSQCNNTAYVINSTFLRVVPFNGPFPLPGASQWGNTDFGNTGTDIGNQSYIQNISWNGALNYNKFVLGTTNWQQAPLPFEMKYFKASGKENLVQLEWSLNFNQQVKSFVIERSRDGIRFETLKQVIARSNETNVSYADADPAPYNGWGYYRLRITDISGQITYTSTQKVWFGKKGSFIQVTPNPAVNDVWISIAQPEKITELNLMNSIGQVLYKTNKLNSLNRIDVSSFAPGIYYLRMTGKDGVFVETVVKK